MAELSEARELLLSVVTDQSHDGDTEASAG
jgi:hypothetical protein